MTVEQAFEMAKSGSQALMRAWADTVTAEQLAAVDEAVKAGARVRVTVDGGLNGETFVVSGWLVHGADVQRLFELSAPETPSSPPRLRLVH
jgi:hypothetical protein